MHRFGILFFHLFIVSFMAAQDFNYNEALVPQYHLPNLLETVDTKTSIATSADWETVGRPALLQSISSEMFGHFPGDDLKVDFNVERDQSVFDGIARRKEVTIRISNGAKELEMQLLIYLPTNIEGPVATFLGLNFYGNHSIHNDPGISIPKSWVRNNPDFDIKNNKASEANRGVRADHWDVEALLKNGFALATMYYGDIDPDFDDGFKNGVHGLLNKDQDSTNYSALSAWAWGLSRAMDYFEIDDDIDATHIALMGHSRIGKAALWAGALDQRFAIVISNDSGCGGAALSRRKYGETVERINTSFPHWFCKAFHQYNDREDQLPFDQHGLLALIAPRPMYVASAIEDQWADPKGELLSLKNASAIYALYGENEMHQAELPPVHQPILNGQLGYHIRAGGHDVVSYDWMQFILFAKSHFQSSQ